MFPGNPLVTRAGANNNWNNQGMPPITIENQQILVINLESQTSGEIPQPQTETSVPAESQLVIITTILPPIS